MDKKIYPFDVLTMKSIGLDKWINGFCDEWPVTIDEFIEIDSSIQNIYYSYILDKSSGYSDIFLVAYKLIYEYTIFSVHAIAFDRLTKEKYTVTYNQNSPYLDFLSDKTEEIKTFSYSNKLIPMIPNISYKVKQRIKHYLRYNRNSVLDLSHNNNGDHYLCVLYPTKELISFANSHNKELKVVYPYNLLNNYNYKPRDYNEITNFIIKDVISIINNLGTKVENNKISGLKTLTKNILEKIDLNIFLISQYFKRIKPTHVLTPIFGNIFSRSVCVAAKRNNHKIVGHSHGNNIGMLKDPQWGAIELSLADEFIVKNDISKKLWKSYVDQHDLLDSSSPKFKVMKDNHFIDFFNINDKYLVSNTKSTIKKIMIYEHDMKYYSPSSPHTYWQYNLDLLIRVAKDLKANGFTTILKRSPASLTETNNLYNKYFDQIIDEKFEECFYKADAILFIYATSTGFPFSLFTKLPVIIFSHELDHYQNDVQLELKERISVVKTRFVKNKIIYDTPELIKAFTNNKNIINQNFINKYYLS